MDDEMFKHWVKIFAGSALILAVAWALYSLYASSQINWLQTALFAVIGGILTAMALTVNHHVLARWLRLFIISTVIIAVTWAAFEYYLQQSFDYMQILLRGGLIGVAIATAQVVMFPERHVCPPCPACAPKQAYANEMPRAISAKARPAGAKKKAKKKGKRKSN
ncbi:MAG: hypothetical protein V1728_03040 [Candidatus Micrarchaeota archaeon]